MNLKPQLKQVLAIKGVRSAALIDGDGLVVEGVANDDTDLSFIGSAIAGSLASSKALAGLLGEGKLTQTMIEYEEGPVLLSPLEADGREFVMALRLDGPADLGRVRFQLRRLLPELATAVGR